MLRRLREHRRISLLTHRPWPGLVPPIVLCERRRPWLALADAVSDFDIGGVPLNTGAKSAPGVRFGMFRDVAIAADEAFRAWAAELRDLFLPARLACFYLEVPKHSEEFLDVAPGGLPDREATRADALALLKALSPLCDGSTETIVLHFSHQSRDGLGHIWTRGTRPPTPAETAALADALAPFRAWTTPFLHVNLMFDPPLLHSAHARAEFHRLSRRPGPGDAPAP